MVLNRKTLAIFGLTPRRIVLFAGLTLLAAALDGFGMAMFLPVLEFIEKGHSMQALAVGSRLWSILVGAFSLAGLEPTLLTLLLVVLGLIMGRTGMNYVRQCYSSWLTQEVLHQARARLFAALAAAEYSLFDTCSTGRILNLASNEATRVGGYFGAMFTLAIQAVLIAGFVIVLMWINPWMTLFASLVLGLAGALVFYVIRHTRRLGQEVTDSNTNLSFLLVERLTGIRMVKLSAASEREAERIWRSSATLRDVMYGVLKLNARVELVLEPLLAAAALAILYFSVFWFQMSISEVGLFMLILLRLLPLAKEFLRSRQGVLASRAGVAAVVDALEEAQALREDASGALPFTGLSRDIRFCGVSFTYTGAARPALDRVDLTIPAGRITALVGPSGAGKSTLVDLLPRLRLPDAGRILFDGTPSEDFDLASLRRGMAFVSQDAFILNDTVRANLSFARPEAGEEDIWEALDRARAREFVESLPKGLDSVLGERGVTLSGGQRQRLSLARALVQDSPLLVLDEPTSALDSEVEKDIQQAIEEMRARGRITIIIIAHRLSTIRDADQIVVLSGGRVAEQGTHRELMVSEEWYAKVSGMQNGSGNGR
jgi:ABC-type multidrug transport system fused ATPase/permease subunit